MSINEHPLEDYQIDGSVPQTVPWMHGQNTEAYQAGLGSAKDDQQALDRSALMMRYTDGRLMRRVYPLVSSRDPSTSIPATAGDAERLRRLGAAKGITQYGTESDDAFVRRIDSALADATSLGTAGYLVNQLHAYGLPDVQIFEECYTKMAADGATFALRWVVVLGPDFGTLGWAPLVMPFPLGGAVLGVKNMIRAQLLDLVRILRAGKTAVSHPLAIVFRFGDFPVLGCGIAMGGFKLGGSGGAGNGYARAPIGEGGTLGKVTLGFKLGTQYARV